MENKPSSWFTAVAAISGVAAIALGAVARDYKDLGAVVPLVSTGSGQLVASREAGQQDPVIDIPEGQYFRGLSQLVKETYVDPIKDDQKLALGAVKGMVMSLDDPATIYYEKDVFEAIQSARNGKVHGVGVDLMLKFPPKPAEKPSTEPGAAPPEPPIPSLVVVSVAPGSPADKAGVKPGDEVDTVMTHWVLSPGLISRFRKVSDAVAKGRASATELKELRKEVRTKMEGSIMPMRAYQMLRTGTSGTIDVIWRRGGTTLKTQLTKQVTEVAPVSKDGNTFVVRLVAGVGNALKTQLPASGEVVLDLRHNADSDGARLKETLEALLPAGTYGSLVPERPNAVGTPLKVATGVSGERTFTVMVDENTRGVAGVVAQVLKSYKKATVQGTLSDDRRLTEVVELPDGSGFTLARFAYKPEETR
jgi:C-terminal processing protease CtpA/Prc